MRKGHHTCVPITCNCTVLSQCVYYTVYFIPETESKAFLVLFRLKATITRVTITAISNTTPEAPPTTTTTAAMIDPPAPDTVTSYDHQCMHGYVHGMV